MAGKGRKKAANRKARPKGLDIETADGGSIGFFEVMQNLFGKTLGMPEPINIRGRGTRSRAWRDFDKAIKLVEKASSLEDEEVQKRLAREAIAISADCSAAHQMLGHLAMESGDASAEQHFREGIAGGERLLGPGVLEDHAGQLGHIPEAGGYLSCRRGLVQCLVLAGRTEEAADECYELVDLDDDDEMASRCILLDLLISLGRFDDARELCIEHCCEQETEWAYSRALVEFAAAGDSSRARAHLAGAIRLNPFVPGMVLSGEQFESVPFFGERGGEDEAMAYVEASRRSWLDVPGALSWLREATNMPLRGAAEPRRKAPTAKALKVIAALPQHDDETWQVDLRRNRGQGWTFYVATDDCRLLEGEVSDTRPGATRLWGLLEDVMRRPSDGDPRRPGTIAARLGALPKSWNASFARLGIKQEWRDSLSVIDAAVAHVNAQVEAADDAARAEADPDSDPRADSVELASLPQLDDEVWEAAVRLAPSWITGEGEPYRPWFGLVASQTRDVAIVPDVRSEPPGPQTLLRLIQRAIRKAGVRPGCIEVADEATVAGLRNGLEPAGIEIRHSGEGMPTTTRLTSFLAESMDGPVSIPPLVKVPGMTESIQRNLYAAAATFYRERPWRKAPSDSVVDVREPGENGRLFHLVVMGQSGVQQGLAIYEDAASLEGALSGDEDAAARGTSMALMYGEPFEIHASDLDMIEQRGFEVAGPEAWPLVVRMNPGRSLRPLLAWEAEVFAACLPLVPGFLAAVPFQRRGGRSGGKAAGVWKSPSGHELSWR